MNRHPPSLAYSRPASPVGQKFNKNASILLIGQNGVGKSIASSLAGDALQREVVHCGPQLSSEQAISILLEHRWGKVIVLEYDLLGHDQLAHAVTEYGQRHGPVVLVTRKLESVLAELRVRGTTDAHLQEIAHHWPERATLLRSLATYIFPLIESSVDGPDSYTKQIVRHGELSDEHVLSPVNDPSSSPYIKQDLLRLLRFIRGTNTNHVPINSNQSYYLALTFGNIELAQPVIEELSIGIDCWELRADLLADHSLDSIIHQVGLLRRYSDLPIIFSMRTRRQAGSLPDPEEDASVINEIFEAASTALKLGVEYLDISNTLSRHLWESLIRSKGNTKIIASYQDFEGRLSWRQDEALLRSYYLEACELGADVVRLVNLAKNVHDNLEARKFAVDVQREVPLIVINVGTLGKMSRVWNHFLTPVSHALLPKVSAPGQMTYLESQQLLYLMSSTSPKIFYLFGDNLIHRFSPIIHNIAFRKLGLPYTFEQVETDLVDRYEQVMRKPSFGGAAVTRPHKVDIIPLLQRLSPHARSIGAINTIVATPTGCVGENTDWRAIHTCILRSRLRADLVGQNPLVLVLGAGGLARAAVYAMLQLGIRRVQVVNKTGPRAVALVESLSRLDSAFELAWLPDPSKMDSPDIVISTIPQLDSTAQLEALISPTQVFAKPTGILLDMAYGTELTSHLRTALEGMGGKSWDCISAVDTLLEQGYEQVRLWTGRRAPRQAIREAVLGAMM